MDWILFTVVLLCSAPVCQAQSGTSLIDAYSPTSVLSSSATAPLGTTVILVCRVGGVASGTQLSYTWTCPNGPCDVGEGNNPNRKTYGDRMVLNVLTSMDGGTYTCLVREGQNDVHGSTFTLNVQGGSVLSSYNRLIPNNAIIFDNGVTEDTNVGDILPPDDSSSVAIIDCSTDSPTQPLTWTDGAGQPVPTSPNLTVYQTTNESSAALHIDTTDTSTFTNGRYQCDGGVERAVNIYINREGAHTATIGLPDLQGLFREDSVARFLLTQATAERSERYISSLERTGLGVPLEVEFEETQSSGADGDIIDRHVSAPGAVYNVKIWSINGASFSSDPQVASTTLLFDTTPSVPRLLSVTRILSDGFELNWLPPREPNGRPVYEIEYGTDDTNFTTVDTGSGDTYYNLTGLQNNTIYYIRVVAVNYIESNSSIRGQESNTLTVTLGHQPPLTPITTPTTTDMPSPGTTGGISDILPIVIPVLVVVSICTLLMVPLTVGICCVARRRRKEVDNHKKGDIPLEGYYNVNADGKPDNVEVNHTTAEYTYITTNSLSPGENEDQTAQYAYVNDEKGSRDRLNNSCDRLTASTDKLNTPYAMLDPADDELGDAAVLANEHAEADDVAQRPRNETQPAIDSQHVQSAEYAVIAEVTHSTPHTPPLSSQDYATIPDKPEEGLYDTADHTPSQEADTRATPPISGYASIVEPGQQAADDTKQPPPVPAFDPEILYTQPDKTSKAKHGGYETIPDTLGSATADRDYESVDMPHAGTEKQPKVPNPTTTHHEAPDFGYDTVPEASGPVAEGGYEAVDIPHTKTATAREAEARKLPDKPTASRPGQPTSSISETSSSQDYATIPDKEPEEGLYDTADHVPPQEADTQATPPIADYASIVEPGQQGADDTEQPPPVPAFDPEILYTQPDKTSKAKHGGYETIPDTPGSATAATRVIDIPHTKTATAREAEARKLPDKPTASRPGQPTGSIYETISDSTLPQPADAPPDYEVVHYPPSSHPAQGRSPPVQSMGSDGDNLYAEPERTVEQRVAKDKADGYATVDDKGGKVAQPQRPIPAVELYSTPDMSQKKNRRRESQGSVGGEGNKDTTPDTLTAVDQLYATPDMSKKQRKQPHVSNTTPPEEQQDRDDDGDATPPEVPVYQPITGVNSK